MSARLSRGRFGSCRLLQPAPSNTFWSQVLSGLAGKIPLESMTGRRVVAICNLKPAKMRGLFSYAMIFAASSESASGTCARALR
jgi:hypothetical protein